MPYMINGMQPPEMDPYLPGMLQGQRNAEMTSLLAGLANARAMAESNRFNAVAALQGDLARNETDRYRAETERTGVGANYDMGLRQMAGQRELGLGEQDVNRMQILAQQNMLQSQLNHQRAMGLDKMGMMQGVLGQQARAGLQDQVARMVSDGVPVEAAMAMAQMLQGMNTGQTGGPPGAAPAAASPQETIRKYQNKRANQEAILSQPVTVRSFDQMADIYGSGNHGSFIRSNTEDLISELLAADDMQKKFLEMAIGSPTLPQNFGVTPGATEALNSLIDTAQGRFAKERGTWLFSGNVIPDGLRDSDITQVIEMLDRLRTYVGQQSQQNYKELR